MTIDIDSIALDTASKIMAIPASDLGAGQLKAKIQCAVRDAMAAYRPAVPGNAFRTEEELIAMLDSLYEANDSGAVSNRKWEAAQRAIAGIRAPVVMPVGLHADLMAIYTAMQHMGDVLNGMDAVEPEDEAETGEGFAAIDRLLAAAGVVEGQAEATSGHMHNKEKK